MSVDFFKELYDNQISRNKSLADSFNALVNKLSIVGGLIGYFSLKFSPAGDISFWLFLVLIGLAMIFLCVSIFFLYKTNFSSTLDDLAPASQWREHFNDLKSQHVSKEHSDAALKEFNKDIIERYSEAATHNQNVNDQFANALRAATNFLFLTLFATLLGGLPFFYSTTTLVMWNHDRNQVKQESQPMKTQTVPSEELKQEGGPGNVPRPAPVPPSPRPPPVKG